MGKGQKNLSIRKDIYEKYDKIYARNKEALMLLGIESTPELIKVLINLGEQNLPELLSTADRLRMKKTEKAPQP